MKRATAPWSDVILAVLFVAFGVLEESFDQGGSAIARNPEWLDMLLLAGSTLPFAWRRRLPVTVMFALGLAYLARLLVGYETVSTAEVASLAAVYSVGVHAPRPRADLARAGMALLLVVALAGAVMLDRLPFMGATNMVAFWIGVGVFGEVVHVRRQYEAALEDRARQLEAERAKRVQLAVLEERRRISRELHDIWAHSISLILVQAGGAEEVIDAEPARARQALATIQVIARQALSEVRRFVRIDGDGQRPGLDPPPGLDRIVGLAEEMRNAGLAVEIEIPETRPVLSPELDLTVYRIVEQSLTNTVTHGGANATASVRISFPDTRVTVDVVDDGLGAAAPARPDGPGRGLIGMHERVALFNGQLSAGPRAERGFAVHAEMPISGAP